jgi:5-formyltetrahydrofolate cyclo-ligase
MTTKPALRARLRAARDGFTWASPLPVPEAYLTRLAPGLVVAAYHPVGSEADPAPLVAAARAAGCVVALPHVVDRATPLRFLEHDAATPLDTGPFGLSQPAMETREVAPAIVLTPLVGFDRRGNRLGQGAGHYDRAFAAHPDAWRIGVAWSVQEVAGLEADPWDVPLHAVITEKEWIVTS